MTRAQREVLSQRICNFYCDAANKSVKTTVLKSKIFLKILFIIQGVAKL